MHLLAGYVSTHLTQLTGKSWQGGENKPAIETALAYVRFKGSFLTTTFLFKENFAMALAKSLYNFIPNGYALLEVMVLGNPAENSGIYYGVDRIDAEPMPEPGVIEMYPELMDRVIAVIKVSCTKDLYLI